MRRKIRKATWWSNGVPVSLVYVPALAKEHPLEGEDEPRKRRKQMTERLQRARDQSAEEK